MTGSRVLEAKGRDILSRGVRLRWIGHRNTLIFLRGAPPRTVPRTDRASVRVMDGAWSESTSPTFHLGYYEIPKLKYFRQSTSSVSVNLGFSFHGILYMTPFTRTPSFLSSHLSPLSSLLSGTSTPLVSSPPDLWSLLLSILARHRQTTEGLRSRT